MKGKMTRWNGFRTNRPGSNCFTGPGHRVPYAHYLSGPKRAVASSRECGLAVTGTSSVTGPSKIQPGSSQSEVPVTPPTSRTMEGQKRPQLNSTFWISHFSRPEMRRDHTRAGTRIANKKGGDQLPGRQSEQNITRGIARSGPDFFPSLLPFPTGTRYTGPRTQVYPWKQTLYQLQLCSSR